MYRACYSKEVAKGSLSGVPLTGGCWRGEAVGGLTRSRASCVIVRVHIWLPLVGPKFEVGTKNKGATGY